jgi:type II secretory pathway component PulM
MSAQDAVRQLPHAAIAAVSRLRARERRLVAAFATLLLLSVIFFGVIEPIANGRSQLEKRIATLVEELDVIKGSAARVTELERIASRKGESTTTPVDFSLFTFVDKAASANVTAGAVSAMNPSRRRVRDGEEESLVEVRLSAVPLTEIVSFLRAIEGANTPVFLRRVDFKRRYDDHSRFDVNVVAVMVERP